MPVKERLEAQEVFGFLRPEQVDVISDAAEVIRCHAGDTVYQKGQHAEFMYVVLEGEVLLRLPGSGGFSIPIDPVTPGMVFGSSMCFDIQTYSTTAQCTQDSKLMRIQSVVFSKLMDEDPRMGYAMQRRISHIYFNRYLETMSKLQAIVMTLPLEAEPQTGSSQTSRPVGV